MKIKFRHEYEHLYSPLDDDGWYKRYHATVCTIWDGDIELAKGVATLSPQDHFSRPVGRAISFYRAFKQIRNRDERIEIAKLIDAKTLKLGRELVGC